MAPQRSMLAGKVDSDDPSELAILVDPRLAFPILATIQEIGPFLDHQVLDVPGVFASSGSALLTEWRSVVRKTGAVAILEQELAKANAGIQAALKDLSRFQALLRSAISFCIRCEMLSCSPVVTPSLS